MLIVDAIHYDYELAGVRDTRNLLTAFNWELPVSYWQNRCNYAMIFEVKDLIDSGTSVDWPALCLGLEELILDESWYPKSGLRNRARIFERFRRIDKIFRAMLGADE